MKISWSVGAAGLAAVVLASSPVLADTCGQASWYGPGFSGRKTASGERFNPNALTAAHRSMPLGSNVRVLNPKTGAAIVVRINDRGPYAHGRIIDLSRGAADALGIRASGVGKVCLAMLR